MATNRWVFTENNNPEGFYDDLEAIFNNEKYVRYICGQLEKASTGQLHFQGYIQLTQKQRLSWLKKRVSHTAHFEPQKASRNDDARDYCMKEETSVKEFVEFGNYVKGRGARSDVTKAVSDFRDAIKSGKTQRELMETNINEMARFPRLYSKIRSLVRPNRPEGSEFKVTLYYGEPGSGKTRKAYEDYPGLYSMPLQTGSSLWMDGYDLHPVVLLDDFAGKMSKMSLTNTLQLLDRYPIQVAEKGGFVWWLPEHIILTTNIHPRAWYQYEDREVHWTALKRRFTNVFIFEKDVTPCPIDPEIFFEDQTLWPVPQNVAFPA